MAATAPGNLSLEQAIGVVEFIQCIVQAVPPRAMKAAGEEYAPFLQLGKFSDSDINNLKKNGIKFGQFFDMTPTERSVVLVNGGFSPTVVDSIEEMLQWMPRPTLIPNVFEIQVGDFVTTQAWITLNRDSKRSSFSHNPHLKEEDFWCLIADRLSKNVLNSHKITFKDESAAILESCKVIDETMEASGASMADRVAACELATTRVKNGSLFVNVKFQAYEGWKDRLIFCVLCDSWISCGIKNIRKPQEHLEA